MVVICIGRVIFRTCNHSIIYIFVRGFAKGDLFEKLSYAVAHVPTQCLIIMPKSGITISACNNENDMLYSIPDM